MPYSNCEDDLSTDRRGLLLQAAALVAGGAAAPLLQAQQPVTEPVPLFKGFQVSSVDTTGATIHVLSGGQGPPLLLLHGYPQTHVMWHKIAARLADNFTVVIPDLRGYGDSSKPLDGENHSNYSKRAMALDQVDVMKHFGFETFGVVGHDRGGRVAHRMALDHPGRVTKMAVLDIVPTYKLFHSVNKEFATAYFHWFLLIQPAPFPETLIGNSVDLMLNHYFRTLVPNAVIPEAYAEYLRCFRNSATVHATCEDYRAAASIDLEHDQVDLDRKVTCPLLALWGERAPMHRMFDILAAWRERANNVSGRAMPCGHYLAEEAPEQTLTELQAFFLS